MYKGARSLEGNATAQSTRDRPYQASRGSRYERCGFLPENRTQPCAGQHHQTSPPQQAAEAGPTHPVGQNSRPYEHRNDRAAHCRSSGLVTRRRIGTRDQTKNLSCSNHWGWIRLGSGSLGRTSRGSPEGTSIQSESLCSEFCPWRRPRQIRSRNEQAQTLELPPEGSRHQPVRAGALPHQRGTPRVQPLCRCAPIGRDNAEFAPSVLRRDSTTRPSKASWPSNKPGPSLPSHDLDVVHPPLQQHSPCNSYREDRRGPPWRRSHSSGMP